MHTSHRPVRMGDLKFLLSDVLNYPRQLTIALVSLGIASAATLSIPYILNGFIDQGFGSSSDKAIAKIFYEMIFATALLSISTALRFYYVSWLGERIVADIRVRVYRHLLKLTPCFFDARPPSEFASQLTSDTLLIDNAVGSAFSIGLRSFLTSVGGCAYLFYLSPQLAGLIIVVLPIILLTVSRFGSIISRLSRMTQYKVASIASLANETLSAIKVVQAFGQEKREGQRFNDASSIALRFAKRRIVYQATMTAATIFLLLGSVCVVVWIGMIDVLAGRSSSGEISAFIITSGIVGNSISALIEVYSEIMVGAGAAGRILDILRQKSNILPGSLKKFPEHNGASLEFKNVSFHYPSNTSNASVKDISFTVQPGETVAIVGPSGAGKSTLFQLIERFYDPTDGVVMVNGVDLRELEPAAIRAQVAIVPQESVIFAASVRDNLRYGHWDATDRQLWNSAEAANAADFLMKLPNGMDTNLGPGGIYLSGGQRQRLTIARALLRDAPVLLLDEATSSLDADSQRLVQQAIEKLIFNRTTLVIAHKLSTVRSAQRIIVMEAGKIVEEGNHSSLYKSGGLYTKLADLQFQA
ncbi:MAG: ATP-binding cassette domain-containing protein [Hymenobacter sp.]|nr:MAG: ATP-binding cassette domain-containing protein [Hymenobacter sp.]